jgi:23S rRNA (pseudouridine1915-N3)-methyltransferase
MKVQFLAVGKNHDEHFDSGISDYKTRIANYFSVEWKIISPPKNAGLLSESDLKKKEADLILKLISPQDFLVALDEKGKMITSTGLADFLQSRANDSVKQLIFLIGGAFGLDAEVMKRANFKWSLSPLTFPHQLVRLILSEQVYRACTILRNERYHHS